MSIEERVGKVEKRVKTVEEAITLLSNLLASHDARLKNPVKDRGNLEAKMTELLAAQARSDARMAALIEAQNKNRN
jgi:uncharacterized coiled-coil protein SlyX